MPNMNSAKDNFKNIIGKDKLNDTSVWFVGTTYRFVYYILGSMVDCKVYKYSPEITFSGIKIKTTSCGANHSWVLGRHRLKWITRCPLSPLGIFHSQVMLRAWYQFSDGGRILRIITIFKTRMCAEKQAFHLGYNQNLWLNSTFKK